MLFILDELNFLCLWSCAENVSGIARKLKIMEGKNWNDYTSDVNLLWMKIEIICAWKWNRRFDMKETQHRKAQQKTRHLIKLLNWNKLWLFGKTSKDINPVARSDSYIVCREKLFSLLFLRRRKPKIEWKIENWNKLNSKNYFSVLFGLWCAISQIHFDVLNCFDSKLIFICSSIALTQATRFVGEGEQTKALLLKTFKTAEKRIMTHFDF